MSFEIYPEKNKQKSKILITCLKDHIVTKAEGHHSSSDIHYHFFLPVIFCSEKTEPFQQSHVFNLLKQSVHQTSPCALILTHDLLHLWNYCQDCNNRLNQHLLNQNQQFTRLSDYVLLVVVLSAAPSSGSLAQILHQIPFLTHPPSFA